MVGHISSIFWLCGFYDLVEIMTPGLHWKTISYGYLKDAAQDISLLSVMPMRARFQETLYQGTSDTVTGRFLNSSIRLVLLFLLQ